jgi:hypothetical protein
MPLMQGSLYAKEARVRTDWVVEDLEKNNDAYRRKLRLEWKLQRNVRIVPSDIPPGLFRGVGEVLDKVYRVYRRLIDWSVNLETWYTSGESFYRFAKWANFVWSGFCTRYVLEGKSVLSDLGVSQFETLKRKIAGTAFNLAIRSNLLKVRV